MAIIDQIKKMQEEGKSDQDITLILQEEGYGIKEVSDILAQANIKKAVSDSPSPNEGAESMTAPYSSESQGLQQSMITETTNELPLPRQDQQYAQQQEQYTQAQNQVYAQAQDQQYAQQQEQYQQNYTQAYPQQYQTYDTPYSNSDVVSDIAEQIVTEKLNSIRKQLETAIEIKTTIEGKLLAMDERLKRVEKVIDRLQLSILQKVGEYLTNVEDIKKEMVETQKSFKSLLDSRK